jgi:hypothetical protein
LQQAGSDRRTSARLTVGNDFFIFWYGIKLIFQVSKHVMVGTRNVIIIPINFFFNEVHSQNLLKNHNLLENSQKKKQ